MGIIIAPILVNDVIMQCITGSEFTVPITFYQDMTRTQLLDLRGYHARLQVRKSPTDPSPLVDARDPDPAFPLVPRGIVLGGVLGTLVIMLADTLTLALPSGEYPMGLQWQPPGHTMTTIMRGTFIIVSGVAHD